MAIKEIKREWSPCQLGYVKEFLLHTEEDLKDMPKCSVGSKATISETDNEYVKTPNGWKLISECDEDGGQGAGGGGGGSGGDTLMVELTGMTPNDDTGMSFNVTLSKTHAEILSAVASGTNVMLKMNDGSGWTILTLVFANPDYVLWQTTVEGATMAVQCSPDHAIMNISSGAEGRVIVNKFHLTKTNESDGTALGYLDNTFEYLLELAQQGADVVCDFFLDSAYTQRFHLVEYSVNEMRYHYAFSGGFATIIHTPNSATYSVTTN